MRAGTLRHQIRFERQTTSQDAAGQQLDTWTLIATARAGIFPVSGRKYFNASGERAEVTHEIHVRHREDLVGLKPRDRAVLGSRIFDIQSVINVRERNRELHLMVTEHV